MFCRDAALLHTILLECWQSLNRICNYISVGRFVVFGLPPHPAVLLISFFIVPLIIFGFTLLSEMTVLIQPFFVYASYSSFSCG